MKVIITLLLCLTTAKSAESMTGYFLAAGIPLIATGLSCVFVGASMQPSVDYQDNLVTRLNQENADIVTRNREIKYLEALESKQKSLKTVGYVFAGAGAGALIIAMLEHNRQRKFALTPQISNNYTGLKLTCQI